MGARWEGGGGVGDEGGEIERYKLVVAGSSRACKVQHEERSHCYCNNRVVSDGHQIYRGDPKLYKCLVAMSST